VKRGGSIYIKSRSMESYQVNPAHMRSPRRLPTSMRPMENLNGSPSTERTRCGADTNGAVTRSSSRRRGDQRWGDYGNVLESSATVVLLHRLMYATRKDGGPRRPAGHASNQNNGMRDPRGDAADGMTHLGSGSTFLLFFRAAFYGLETRACVNIERHGLGHAHHHQRPEMVWRRDHAARARYNPELMDEPHASQGRPPGGKDSRSAGQAWRPTRSRCSLVARRPGGGRATRRDLVRTPLEKRYRRRIRWRGATARRYLHSQPFHDRGRLAALARHDLAREVVALLPVAGPRGRAVWASVDIRRRLRCGLGRCSQSFVRDSSPFERRLSLQSRLREDRHSLATVGRLSRADGS